MTRGPGGGGWIATCRYARMAVTGQMLGLVRPINSVHPTPKESVLLPWKVIATYVGPW